MNRRTLNIILIMLGVLGVLLLIVFAFNDEKTYSWNENFMASSDQPYGTKFMKELLEEFREGKFVIRQKNSLGQILDDED